MSLRKVIYFFGCLVIVSRVGIRRKQENDGNKRYTVEIPWIQIRIISRLVELNLQKPARYVLQPR